MKQKLHNPKTMIKCKFSNQIHDIFNGLLTEEQRTKNYYNKSWYRENNYKKLTEEQKQEFMKKIFDVYEASTKELTNYLKNKRFKKDVAKKRAAKAQQNVNNAQAN